MSTYCITQNMDRCIGCLSCEVYCKESKQLPDGPRLCQIAILGQRTIRALPREAYVYLGCFHCHNAACMAACPTRAVKKRDDGIVYIEAELCVGCKSCMVACPWGAVQWNPVTEKAVKCDLCKDRLDQGLKPVCVTVCTTQCLSLNTIEAPRAAVPASR
jgi:Fe-S-cluster-containing dehydrogenase component